MPNEPVTPETSATHDVVVVADLRLPAETPTSLPDEIAAQAAAGYTTAVADIPRESAASLRPVHPRLQHCLQRGLADLVYGDHSAHGRLLVVREPEEFPESPGQSPRVGGDQRLVVAERPAVDGRRDLDWVPAAHVAVGGLFGSGLLWAPADPFVRDTLDPSGTGVALTPWDWAHTIDVGSREVVRPSLTGRRPVIGAWMWTGAYGRPARAEEILAACPGAAEFALEVVEAGPQVSESRARLPASWTVHRLATMSLAHFLARVDLLLHADDPDPGKAPLLIPLEALASGATPVLPERFRATFGDACRYERAGVAEAVRSAVRDPEAHNAQVEEGRRFVRRHFGPDVHLGRLRSLVGSPSRPSTPSGNRTKPRGAVPVLFISSNGVGMGHLTRLMAMARQANSAIRPSFLTASQAVEPVRSLGFPCDYVPSRGYLGCSGPQWNRLLQERIEQAIEHHQPRTVVFDGTSPYVGLLRAREDHPDLPFVWSRRAMWQEGKSQWAVDQSAAFDRVIEPGEIAADYDRGVTVPARGFVDLVPPVTLLGAEELLDGDQARTALGLDPACPAALVHLGAGNINDTAPIVDAIVSALRGWPGLQICVTSAAIADRPVARPEDVTTLSVYPLSRYMRAFDLAVSAAGYNSFHELIRARVPTIFVPNTATQLDDQVVRARYAQDHGLGRLLTESQEVGEVVASLMDERVRHDIRGRCAEADVGNGAGPAMDVVERLAIPWVNTEVFSG